MDKLETDLKDAIGKVIQRYPLDTLRVYNSLQAVSREILIDMEVISETTKSEKLMAQRRESFDK